MPPPSSPSFHFLPLFFHISPHEGTSKYRRCIKREEGGYGTFRSGKKRGEERRLFHPQHCMSRDFFSFHLRRREIMKKKSSLYSSAHLNESFPFPSSWVRGEGTCLQRFFVSAPRDILVVVFPHLQRESFMISPPPPPHSSSSKLLFCLYRPFSPALFIRVKISRRDTTTVLHCSVRGVDSAFLLR